MTALVDQIQRRPITILVRAPGFPIVVLRDGIRDLQSGYSILQIIQICFVAEFRVVVTDHYQPLISIFLVPFPQRGNYVAAIDSTEGPHIQQDDLTS